MSYSTRIDDVQTSYNEFKSFLNFYLTTRLNKGFNDVNQQFSNTGLLDLNEFVKDESWLDVSTGNNFPSFFDFPMYVKSYGPGGKLGYGVTPDIGFTRNVEKGLSWTQGNMPSSRSWDSVCYGNGKYIAVATNLSNIMAYSTNGINWTQGTMPSSINWSSVCYGNDKFVAVGATTNTMAYSTDGISWTQGNMPSSQNWYSVCYGNDKYVAVSGNTSNIMAYSTDGISWTQGTLPSSQNWNSVCYGNGKYVTVTTANSNIMAYSTDGISWTQGNLPNSQNWRSVCYGNDKYVAVSGNTSNIMAYSTDGISWTQGTLPSSQNWNSVCYGNGKYVTVTTANSNIMAYSTDGISWTQGNLPNSQNWRSVCYGNGKYVAIGGNTNTMVYSINTYSSSTIRNGLYVDYQYPFTKLLSGLKLSVNEPENYYFQITDNNSNQLFTVPMPSTSTVQYLRNNYSRLFPVSIFRVNAQIDLQSLDGVEPQNLFVFASFYRSSSNGGLVLYVSPDLIHWNVHQLIPGTATSTEVNTLIGTTSTSLSLSSSNATIMQNALRKYVGFLPNGQYVVMYPYEMYKQSGDNMQNMAVLYSPYQNEPLMTINDPYGDEDWENKAINGISAIVDKYRCFDIYYNNRLNCPLSLGISEVINIDLVSAGENTGIPVIVKAKNNYTTGETLYQWNLEASTAPGDHDSAGAAGGTKDINTPLLATAICTLDKDSEMLEDMPLNVRLCSVIGDYGSGEYKSITLLTKEATPYAGNTDEDMSNYITEFYNPFNLDYGTNFGISFKDKSFFVYIPTTDEISKKKTIARITAIGDTASNYSQKIREFP